MDFFNLKLPELEKGLNVSETSCFRRVEVQEHLSLLPCYIGRLADGIIEHLNRNMLRYLSSCGGVLVSYSKPVVLQSYGKIFDEQPHIHFDIRYSAYVFKPTVNSILCGTVNKIGGDHVGCLVYDCFNASLIAPPPTSKNGYNISFSSNFQIGSKVWFMVTKLDIIGGILSITGEHVDFGSILDPEAEIKLQTPSNLTRKKCKRDQKHSRDKPGRERQKPHKRKHVSSDLEDEVVHKRKKHKPK